MSTRVDGESLEAADGPELTLPEAVGDAANVLLMAPSMGDRCDEGCVALLQAAPPSETNVLYVAYTGAARDRLRVWDARLGKDTPAKTGIVDIGTSDKPAATDGGPSHPVEVVSDPADLTGLGIKLHAYCSTWGTEKNQVAVCFHSLSTLLQYVQGKRAFRFLHHVTGLLRSVDAAAHFHLDPGVHDDRTLNKVYPLFDAVVEPSPDDGWEVTTK